jgi:spore coat polysaccharide biosynthesis protein SpsF
MVTAIIQARMHSRRLPGKVLKKILGKPVLLYQVERLRTVDEIKQIVIATTTSREDDQIIRLCEEESIAYFRGAVGDVLERCYQTARHYDADPILRLTADCPLITPEELKMQINYYLNNEYDYVYLGRTFAEGICCDLFSFRALEITHKNATLKLEREHVTPYMHKHHELFKITGLENKTDDSKYRFVIDEPEDFEVVKAIIEALCRDNSKPCNAEDIKAFLDNNPDIFKKNAHIIRNEDYEVFS